MRGPRDSSAETDNLSEKLLVGGAPHVLVSNGELDPGVHSSGVPGKFRTRSRHCGGKGAAFHSRRSPSTAQSPFSCGVVRGEGKAPRANRTSAGPWHLWSPQLCGREGAFLGKRSLRGRDCVGSEKREEYSLTPIRPSLSSGRTD